MADGITPPLRILLANAFLSPRVRRGARRFAPRGRTEQKRAAAAQQRSVALRLTAKAVQHYATALVGKSRPMRRKSDECALVRLLLVVRNAADLMDPRRDDHMNHYFNRLAERTSRALGSAWAFVAAVTVVAVWALSGPACRYNDTWQLTINTGTTIVTFLMVFLIQNSQNREARATQLKIDELLRAIEQARTSMVNLQDLTEQELAALEADFRRLGKKADSPVLSQRSRLVP